MSTTIKLASTDSSGNPASAPSDYQVSSTDASISGDGKHVAFISDATNLIAGQVFRASGSPLNEIYIKNITTGAVTLASSTSAGVAYQSNGGFVDATSGAITENGNAAVFRGFDLIDYSGQGSAGIFEKSLTTGALTAVSTTGTGVLANGDVDAFAASADGHLVAFTARASNLDPIATGSYYETFLKNLTTGAVSLISETATGVQANNASGEVAISGDGSEVTFISSASNLVSGTIRGVPEVYVRNVTTGAVTLVSQTADGHIIDGGYASTGNTRGATNISMSSDGTKVAFIDIDQSATGDPYLHVFVKNLTTGALTVVANPDGATSPVAEISPDGTHLLYDGNGDGSQVHLIDITTGQSITLTQNRVSGSTGSSDVTSDGYDLSANNSVGAFQTLSPALSPPSMINDAGNATGNSIVAAQIDLSGLQHPSAPSFNFALGSAHFDFSNGRDVMTTPSGAVIDLTSATTITFTDGVVHEHAGSVLIDDLYYDVNNPDVYAAHLDPTTHYNASGWHEGRNPNADFSTTGYLAANADVRAAGINPLTHYDQYGWKEGRDPSANFDNELYLANNPDVKAAGIDPLAHYLAYGQAEGRQAYAAIGKAADLAVHPGFDAEYYLLSNPDVAKAAISAGGDSFAFAYNHYETYGWHEGRNPDADFSVSYYLANNPDVAAAKIDPLSHYDQYGFKEGRDPSAAFHTSAYEATNPDVATAHIDPLLHYLQYGAVEGRHLA